MAAQQQVWLITGASAGFGKAFAEYGIAQRHHVVVAARSPDKLEAIRAAAPDQVEAVRMDVNDPEQVAAGVRQALSRFGRVDVLFNNAGYGIVGAAEETPEAELRAQMETNFFGAVAVTQALLPHFRQQRAGAIVNMSSLGGQTSFAGFSAYSASKFALEGYSEALAEEMAAFGVKVLIVEPGAFRTNFAGAALRHMPALAAYEPVVGGTRAFARGMDGSQAGDPLKAAAAIAAALRAEHTPLRLQLGPDAVAAVEAHAENLLRDLSTWRQTALQTTFD